MFQDVMRDPALRIFLAILITAFSGVPGLFFRKGPAGQRLATLCALAASFLALPAIVPLLLALRPVSYQLLWSLPFGPCEVGLDPLTLFFLIPVFIVFPLGTLYGNGYWPNAEKPTSQPSLTFFYGLLAASMALVTVSRNGALFLIGWEVMALSGFFLLICEHEEQEVRSAGMLYLVASHLGVAALLALFSALSLHLGSFLFPATAALKLGPEEALPLYLLALFGFCSKSGLMPLHLWLPSAHANAPSHVSALLSGVMLKIGLYGLLRVISFFPERPLWLGGVLLTAGLASAVVGIAVAVPQRDLKRLLAYSSIENLGIIAAALGAALIGEATGNARLAFLALTGALFHTLNHALFKPLLFMGAGAVIHATGTRDLNLMGGLARRMPRGALLTLVGAVAICGLPPGNGFVSEFLIYLGFFGEATSRSPFLALGAPVLALVGGVAVVGFVKLYGIAFLGAPRSEAAKGCHEPAATMLLPMALLAFLCLAGGLFPEPFLALTRPVLATLAPVATGYPGLPLSPVWFAVAGGGVLVFSLTLGLILKGKGSSAAGAPVATWGCGYLAPTSRMQYTGTSFSEFIATFLGWVARGRVLKGPIAGFAPAPSGLEVRTREVILERGIIPFFRVLGVGFSYLRRLQHGEVQVYILYIFVTLFVLMLWVR